MSLMMSSISHLQAEVQVREQFSFTSGHQKKLLLQILEEPGVEGAVLLCTCNRTELYVTGDCATPWRMLAKAADIPMKGLEELFVTLTGEDAARHLMEVACGQCSQLKGEEQILTQVRKAMDFAHDCGSINSTLSTLFRMAVTVGKRVRTQIPVTHGSPTAGEMTASLLQDIWGRVQGRNVLVIGNGQMGRLVASRLQQVGANVTVTLRHYRHRETIVPAGCATIAYEDRVSLFTKLDAIISATTSPHYTVLKHHLAGLNRPLVLVDLAVPRDIDPDCQQFENIRYYDIDTFAADDPDRQRDGRIVSELIDRQMQEYLRWQHSQAVPARPCHFPMFVDLSGKKVVIVGGGKIAARRIASLRLFGCRIVVIAPQLQMQQNDFEWEQREYSPHDLNGAALVIAATDNRQVNHQVGRDARKLGIPVSVADCREECTFFFPAVCAGAGVVAGVVSQNKNPHATATAAKEIRKALLQLECAEGALEES